ncbi:MAG: shikimate dehydrogenase [Micrococcales bacterium]|nr:MAG: shikimate dehydrogenase [Micrococcales bacterium]
MVAGQRLNQNPAGAGDVQRCAVLGSPIGHSRSPVLHRAAYVALGLNWQYEAYDVTVEQLPGFLAGLDSSWRGLSITMPLKQAVKSYVHETSLLADLLDSVNTVLLSWPDAEQPSPWMYGENTDVLGMVAAVRELWVDDDHPGLRGCVLGAGATARSALAALVELGCRQVQVVVRRPPAAAHLHDLADRLGLQLQVQDWAAAWDGIAAADVVISTVPPGATDTLVVQPAPASLAGHLLLDVVYHPWPTRLASAVQDRGGLVVGGVSMLLHQAAAQVELMTGIRPAPIQAMRAAS